MKAALQIFKSSIGSYSLIYPLVLITAGSFILQPTNIRIYGISLTGTLMIATTFFFVFNWRRHLPLSAIFTVTTLTTLLIINNSFMNRNILAMLLYIVYFIGFSNYKLFNLKQIRNIWKILGYTCLALAFIGFYRYIFGFADNPLSENKLGIFSDARTYHYMGISYYPSTRNSDAIYFGVGFIIFTFLIRGKIGLNRYINYFFLIFLGFVCIITFSRGLWISILLAFFCVYYKVILIKIKNSYLYLIILINFFLVGVLFFKPIEKILINSINNTKIPYDPFNTPPYVFSEKLSSLIKQLISSIISIFNPNFAREKLGSLSSNYDRIDLLVNGWNNFLNNKFGIKPIYIDGQYRLPLIHYENIYLDLLIIFGIFIIPIIFFLIIKFKCIIKMQDSFSKFLFLIYLFIIIYHLFNSGINFIFLWFILSLTILSINYVQLSKGRPT